MLKSKFFYAKYKKGRKALVTEMSLSLALFGLLFLTF